MAKNLFIEPKDNTGILKVGTSGWNYPPNTGPGTWTGIFYPFAKVDELKFYSRFFNAVEVNSTFYRPCDPKTALGWARRTPQDFEFTVKVWQKFTHNQAEWTQQDVDLFRPGIEALAETGRLGCLLFQFPASFHCNKETMNSLESLLKMFTPYPKAVELRHNSWNSARALLEDQGAVPTFIDEPKFHSSIRQELGRSGDMVYLRFHGRHAAKWWKHETRSERYDYLYSPDELQPYAARIKELKGDASLRKVYAFFNNHPGAKAVVNAIMLRARLDIPVQAPLPQSLIQRFPELAV